MTPKEARTRQKGVVAPQISQSLERMWDSGFVNALMQLNTWIRDNIKPSNTRDQILEHITQMTGIFDENQHDSSR